MYKHIEEAVVHVGPTIKNRFRIIEDKNEAENEQRLEKEGENELCREA